MSRLTKRTQIAAKLETTEGTQISLLAADAFLAFNPVFTPVIEMHERAPVTASLSKYPSISGKRSAKLAFDCELVGSGTAGTAPFWGKLMIACGYAETIVPVTSVTYRPSSDNQGNSKSLTLAAYIDGTIKRIWGARGNVRLSMEAGKPGILSFEFEGADFEVLDGALLTGVTYPSILPPAFLNAALTLDSYAALCSKVEIDTGNVLYKRESIAAPSGHRFVTITGRNPRGSLDPELPTVAAYDFYGKWRTPGTLGALQLSASGGAGNIGTVSCPNVRYAAISPADRGGLAALNIDFEPTLNTSNDEISIAMT